MCGRFVDPNLRGTEFEHSEIKIAPFPRRFNVKPTEDVLIFAKEPLEAMLARWGLIPSWHKGELRDWKARTFNARIEEAKDKPTFRQVWRHGRCLIPAAGYYEWSGAPGAKQPHFISSAGNEETLWFAGLASRWQGLLTCTMMTRAATPEMTWLHPRMPVILNAEERDAWLAGTDDTELGGHVQLHQHEVARFSLHDDGPQLIEGIG
ncbi:SOS response-associated peptidase [Sinirhodobacter sp. WL0062]|uniref:Abasic site processing protein n=1 Tax=Rhodobacter flavimaris TaxID=2907145 RepID=A0ABS8YU96_9RHOB|nr:SOS response-associated peptidase [Sinirhodobacter sp. WL0062]MCE5973422.1 SOS response-associated peptidase [Sinirhodobacter sp. WL0062]